MGQTFAKFLLCCAVTVLGARASAVDMDDVNADVEESMSDSDATTTQARLARERAAKEKAETEGQHRQAAQRQVAADAKKRDATKALARSENEIAGYKAEQKKHQHDRAVADGEIAREEAKLKAMQTRLTKAKVELDALVNLREQQKKKIATLTQQTQDTELNTVRVGSDFEQTKGDFKRGQIEEKQKQDKLTLAQRQNAAQKVAIQKQIDHLKAEYKVSKDRTLAMEKANASQQQKNAKMQEQAKWAKDQAHRQPAANPAPASTSAPAP